MGAALETPVVEFVSLDVIRRDGGTQQRARIDDDVVAEYADAYRAGRHLPALVVFYDGADYWLADGFHRWRAAVRAELEDIDCEVRSGTRRDAVLHSVGANAHHGLRRTREDKRRAVHTLLLDEEWGSRSDRWIAEKCGVSHRTVAAHRADLEEAGQLDNLPRRVGADGRSRPATKTTVTLDGDPGPEEEPWTPDGEQAGLDLGDQSPPPRPRSSSGSTFKTDRLDPGKGEGFPGSGTALVRKWREVLRLPERGAVSATQLLNAVERLRGIESNDELERAKALGLSQWFTRPEEATRLAELAFEGLTARDAPVRVLEPAAGAGALLRALPEACGAHTVTTIAYDVDPAWEDTLTAIADEVVIGDFLEEADAGVEPRADVVITNPPYENGLDGRFLEAAMRLADRVVALVRLNALVGQDRVERVWSQVEEGSWVLSVLELLALRPGFEGPGDMGARSDYVIVRLDRVSEHVEIHARTDVRWIA